MWWLKKKQNNKDFLKASQEGDILRLIKLLDAEQNKDLVAEINVRGDNRWHALHYASQSGHEQVVSYLLNHAKVEK